jgi:tetratricopeptide (TPR) repeat protein
VLAVLLTTILTAVAPAAARGIHYGAVVDEAVLACDRLHWAGATERSIPCYQDVLASTANASDKAEAAWAMNELQAANAYFRDAMNQEPQDAATLTRWGDLFADTHQEAEAMNIYREALQLDPDYGFALLGAATVLVGGFDEAASAYLEQLLSGSGVHEGAQVGAWLLVARMALENSSTEAAREALDKSTDLVARNDWPLLWKASGRKSPSMPIPVTAASTRHRHIYMSSRAVIAKPSVCIRKRWTSSRALRPRTRRWASTCCATTR